MGTGKLSRCSNPLQRRCIQAEPLSNLLAAIDS